MKRQRNSGGGSNWMDTYGDMVTLLLCFFVLLYSISKVDQEKWMNLVHSLNPEANENTELGSTGQDNDSAVTEDLQSLDTQMDELYERMSEYASQNGYSISVKKGENYVLVSLEDIIFFDGDSYALRQEGKDILNDVGAMLSDAADIIDEVCILGHTAQGRAESENNPATDRFLASNRATTVLVYLQELGFIDPDQLISIGYGQWRPIASNDTAANREKNRRVEMVVTSINYEGDLFEIIEEYYSNLH